MDRSSRTARRNFLVNAKLQLSVVLPMAGCVFAFTLVYAITYAVASHGELGPAADGLERLGYLVTGTYFALATLATLLLGILVTHRVAGPVGVIEEAVKKLRDEDYEVRLELRENDLLWPLAGELKELAGALRTARSSREELRHELRSALEAGDGKRALELLDRGGPAEDSVGTAA